MLQNSLNSMMLSSHSDIADVPAWKMKVICGLVFLFPAAGVSVEHWFSAIFVILAFSALWELVVRGTWRQTLFKDERIWLWLCGGFFLTFLLVSFVNGWDRAQNRSLGVDIRFILAVPLFLMLRRYSNAGPMLLWGCLVGAVLLFGQSCYDVFIAGIERAQGFYSPNLLGPVGALVAVILLVAWRLMPRWRWAIGVAIPCALGAIALSGSRGAYVGLMAMIFVWVLMTFKGKQRILILVAAILLPIVAYFTVEPVNKRVGIAIHQVVAYFESGAVKSEAGEESTSIRFEMWRAAWMAFEEKPLFGHGTKSYHDKATEYMNQGLIAESAAGHGHAHNAYLDVLMSRGLVGFLVFMGMFFYPLYCFIRDRNRSPETAVMGSCFITGFAAFSMTDASTFIMGNFVSIYLLFTVVFLSWHVRQVYSRAESV